jgi:hypothetical protein
MSRVFGSLMGSMWMGYVLFANLGGTSVLGTLNQFHPGVYAMTSWFAAGAVAFTAMGGLLAAYWTDNVGTAIRVAACSGVLSAAITIVTVIGVNILFHDAMMKDPSNIHEFVRTVHRLPTDSELSDSIFTDAVGGCVSQIWLGPLLGLVVGGIGALAGKLLRTCRVRMRFAPSLLNV